MMNFLEGAIEGRSKKKLAVASVLLVAIFLFLPFDYANAGILGDVAGDVESLIFSTISLFLRKIVWFFVVFLVNFGAWAVDVFLDPALYKTTLTGHAVDAGWRTVRDFCNMFYMFFLLLVAFSTITRSQAYSAKNVLPKIILSIFLINFSKVITELAIDCGQVFLFGIAGWIGSFSGPTGKGAGLTAIVSLMRSQFEGSDNSSGGTLIILVFSIVYTFMLGSAYLILAGFLLFRLISFVFLIIVSPFAFFALSLPSMKKYWSQWQSALISNIFAGPILIFFIYIASIMALDNITYQPTIETNNLGFIKNSIYYFVQGIIPLGMLYYAVPAAKKMGALGSKYVSDYGTFAMGAYAGTKLAGRGASKVSPLVKAIPINYKGKSIGQHYSDKVQSMNQKLQKNRLIGNMVIKHEVANRGKIRLAVDEHKKIFKTLTEEQMGNYVNHIFDPEKKAQASMAMTETLLEKGKMSNDNLIKAGFKDTAGNFDRAKMLNSLQMAKNYGMDVSDVYKQRMDLLDDPAEIIKEIGKAQAERKTGNIKLDAAKNKVVRDNMISMIGKDQFEKWMLNKSQTEKDSFSKHLKQEVVNGFKDGSITDATDPLVRQFQETDALLSVVKEKEGKMQPITGFDRARGELIYDRTAPVKEDLLKKVLPYIPKNNKLEFDNAFLEKYGHYFAATDHTAIAQRGDSAQKSAVKKSLTDRQSALYATYGPARSTWPHDVDLEMKAIEKKIKAIERTT